MELKINRSECNYLSIVDQDHQKVFEIRGDGSVGYTVKGKYIIANNDKKLGIALGQAFEQLVIINKDQIEAKSKDETPS